MPSNPTVIVAGARVSDRIGGEIENQHAGDAVMGADAVAPVLADT
jgi:hypothetical protein